MILVLDWKRINRWTWRIKRLVRQAGYGRWRARESKGKGQWLRGRSSQTSLTRGGRCKGTRDGTGGRKQKSNRSGQYETRWLVCHATHSTALATPSCRRPFSGCGPPSGLNPLTGQIHVSTLSAQAERYLEKTRNGSSICGSFRLRPHAQRGNHQQRCQKHPPIPPPNLATRPPIRRQ